MTDRLTPEQLTQIRERVEKATEGPWKVADDNRDTEYFPFWVIGGDQVEEGEWFAELHVGHLDDANFIAHAREDIPKLLAHIEKQTEEIRYYKGYADRYPEVIAEQKAEIERLKEALNKLGVMAYPGCHVDPYLSEIVDIIEEAIDDD